MCDLEEKGQVFAVSLTHLEIKSDHPLHDETLRYQKDRVKHIGKVNIDFQPLQGRTWEGREGKVWQGRIQSGKNPIWRLT